MKNLKHGKIVLGIIALVSLLAIQPLQSHTQATLQNISDVVISTELSASSIQRLKSDGLGKIWFGSCGGQNKDAFLVVFDTVTLAFDKWGFKNTQFSPFEQCVGDMEIDNANNKVWFTLIQTGDLGKLDLSTNTTTLFHFSQGPLPGQQNNIAFVDHPTTMALAADGKLWFGIERVQLGVVNLVAFDTNTETFTDEIAMPGGVAHVRLNGIDLWIGQFVNIAKFNTVTKTVTDTYPISVDFKLHDLVVDPLDNTNVWFSERKEPCQQEPDPDSVKFAAYVGKLDTLTRTVTNFKVIEHFDANECATLGIAVDLDGNVWSSTSGSGAAKKAAKLDPITATATVYDVPSGPRYMESFGGSVYYYGISSVHTGKIPLKSTVILKSEMIDGSEFTGAQIQVDRDTVHTSGVLTFRTHSVHTFTTNNMEGKTFVGWFDQNGNPVVGVGSTQELSLRFKADNDAYIIARYM